MRNLARPPIASVVSAVPLVATGTTRDAVSHTPAHRSTAVVDIRYGPRPVGRTLRVPADSFARTEHQRRSRTRVLDEDYVVRNGGACPVHDVDVEHGAGLLDDDGSAVHVSRRVRDTHIGQARPREERHVDRQRHDAARQRANRNGAVVVAGSEGWSPSPSAIGPPLASNCRRWNCGARIGSPPAETSRTRKEAPADSRMTGSRSDRDGGTVTMKRNGARPGTLTTN